MVELETSNLKARVRFPLDAPTIISMQEYQQRVVAEYRELEEKANSLYVFLATSKTFEQLPQAEQELLKMQYYTMQVYSGILAQRIAKF